MAFQRFCDIRVAVLNKHVQRKVKHARGSQTPFFDKEFSKTIMIRT